MAFRLLWYGPHETLLSYSIGVSTVDLILLMKPEPNVFESKLELNLSKLMYQKDYLRQTSSFKTAKKHREWFIIRPGAEPESETAVSKPQCCMNEKKKQNWPNQTKLRTLWLSHRLMQIIWHFGYDCCM